MAARTHQLGSEGLAEEHERGAEPRRWAASRTTWVLALATVVHIVTMLLASAVFPILEVPDERFHVDMVFAVAEGVGYPNAYGRDLGPEMLLASRLREDRRTAKNAPARHSRPTAPLAAELDADGAVANRMAQHPPLYYLLVAAIGNGVITLVPKLHGLSIDQQVWVYRVVSIFFAAPLPVLAYAAARRLSTHPAVPLAAAVFCLGVAGLTIRNGPMVNNDNLFVVLAWATTVLLVSVTVTGSTLPKAVGIGLLTGAALLTKGLALPLLPAVAITYVVVAWRRSRAARSNVLPHAGVALGAALALGGWWWVRNVLLYGRLNPRPAGVATPAPRPGFRPNLLEWFTEAADHHVSTFWSAGGWLGFTRNPVPLLLMVLVVIAGIVFAFWRCHGKRLQLLVALLPVALLLCGMAANSFVRYLETSQIRGENGRYVYGGLVGLAAVVAVGWAAVAGRLARWIPFFFACGAGVVQYFTIRAVVASTYRPRGVTLTQGWDAVLAWSPLPPAPVNALALACATGFVVLVMSVHPRLAFGKR